MGFNKRRKKDSKTVVQQPEVRASGVDRETLVDARFPFLPTQSDLDERHRPRRKKGRLSVWVKSRLLADARNHPDAQDPSRRG